MIKTVLFLLAAFFPLLGNSMPLCISSKLKVKYENIVSFTNFNSRVTDENFFSAFVSMGIEAEHPYSLIISDEKCNLIYSKNYDDHPLSLFSLSDIGDAIFSVSTSGTSYVVDIFYITEKEKINLIFSKHTQSPPSFIYAKKMNSYTMPNIRLLMNDKYVEYKFKNGSYRLNSI